MKNVCMLYVYYTSVNLCTNSDTKSRTTNNVTTNYNLRTKKKDGNATTDKTTDLLLFQVIVVPIRLTCRGVERLSYSSCEVYTILGA